VPDGARRTTFTGADGETLGAAEVGSPDAPHAVVVAHGGSQTLCDWLGIATSLATRADALVVVPDRRGVGSSSHAQTDAGDAPDDLLRAAHRLDRRSVTYAGSSAGAPVALAAALRADDVCSVALVSPASVPDVPASRLAALGAPLFTAVEGGTDRYVGVARELARLAPTATAKGQQVVVAGTTDHSSGLVEHHPEALDLLVIAVTACR
jgi:pimeloyl-ACP methyl ester carboxylesterase